MDKLRQMAVIMALCALAYGGHPPGFARAEPGPDAEAQRRAGVLARFRGGQITVGEMEDAIAKKLPDMRARLATPAGRARFLREMINYELLRRESQRRGYATHPVVEEAWSHAAIEKMVAQQLPERPQAVPAEAVAREYAEHVKQFDRKPQRRASYIVVERESEARALIKQLSGARVSEARFAALARERTLDAATRPRGGDLGHFEQDGKAGPTGTTVAAPAVASATFALKHIGDIARKPVPVPGGFSVVMWTGESLGLHQTLQQLESDIRQRLADQQQQRELDAWIATLRTAAKSEVHPELSDAIQLDPAAPLDIPNGFPAAPPDPTAPPILVAPDGA